MLLAIPATWRTAHLYANLHSDTEELLPPDAESVRAVEELRRRMPGLQFLGVLADVGENASPDASPRPSVSSTIWPPAYGNYPNALVGGVRTGLASEARLHQRATRPC